MRKTITVILTGILGFFTWSEWPRIRYETISWSRGLKCLAIGVASLLAAFTLLHAFGLLTI